MRRRRMGFGVMGMGIVVLAGWVSAAFACTPTAPEVYSILPESAPPGATVTVRGQAVRAEEPVEIRWNGVGGQLLAQAPIAKGAFSIPVQVPQAAPGIYSLTLVTVDGRVGRTAFEVTAAPGSAPSAPAQLWPSLADRPSLSAAEPPGPSMLGVALLAVGLAGLGAGSTVAVAGRRRVLARPQF